MEIISRRAFNLAATSLVAAPYLAWSSAGNVPKLLDHIILGCNDLDAGVDYVFRRTGVRAAAGGVHPGAGTKNALLSLGKLRYLEIIAPDPLQAASTDPRDVADLKSPALVGWAIHREGVDEFASVLKSSGVESVGPKPGSRARPDGTTLTWKSLTLKDDRNGILPFFKLPILHKVDLVYSAEARTGLPFYATTDQGAIYPGDPPGTFRLPSYYTINVQLEKRFHLFGRYWALRGGFNDITNHANVVAANGVLDPAHPTPTFIDGVGRAFTGRLRYLGRQN